MTLKVTRNGQAKIGRDARTDDGTELLQHHRGKQQTATYTRLPKITASLHIVFIVSYKKRAIFTHSLHICIILAMSDTL